MISVLIWQTLLVETEKLKPYGPYGDILQEVVLQ